MIDARLHPADVVAHDEENVGFLSLLGGGGNACHRRGGTQHGKSAPDCSEHAHGCFPQCRLPKPGPQPSPNSTHQSCFAFADPCVIMLWAIGRTPRGGEIGRSAWDALCASGSFIRLCLRIPLQTLSSKVIHRRSCDMSPQSARAPGIDDFERSLRRSLLKDRHVAAPSEPCSAVAARDIAWDLRRGIRRNTSAGFAPVRRFRRKARAC